jgi:hypothetical protein
MRTERITLVVGLAILGVFAGSAQRFAAAGNPNPRPQTWVDCVLYDGVVPSTSLKPNSDAFDELYTGGHGFQDGVPLISDAAPGDPDYNGGRWHLNTLKASVDPDKYSGACSVEDLDLQDFDSTATYFECPLLPRPRP